MRPVGEVDVAWRVGEAERPMDDAAVCAAVRAALEHGGRSGIHISVALVDDETLGQLHGRWLGDPAPTDVMAFDLGEEGEGPAGELVVSVERAAAVAAARGVSIAREVALYVVHGVLHLCGFDDGSDGEAARMRAAEAEVMAILGYPLDDAPHELGGDLPGA